MRTDDLLTGLLTTDAIDVTRGTDLRAVAKTFVDAHRATITRTEATVPHVRPVVDAELLSVPGVRL